MGDTFRDGVEAAARWHEAQAQRYDELEQKLRKYGAEEIARAAAHEDAQAHRHYASTIRALTPPPDGDREALHPDDVIITKATWEWMQGRADRAEAEAAKLATENTRLRAALAQSEQPCAYCSLPADEWAKCQAGFPGCHRADDAMGCPHLGDGMRAEAAEAAAAKLRAVIQEAHDKLHACNRPALREGLRLEVRDMLRAALDKEITHD